MSESSPAAPLPPQPLEAAGQQPVETAKTAAPTSAAGKLPSAEVEAYMVDKHMQPLVNAEADGLESALKLLNELRELRQRQQQDSYYLITVPAVGEPSCDRTPRPTTGGRRPASDRG